MKRRADTSKWEVRFAPSAAGVVLISHGELAPIDRPTTMNVSKAGQAIPLKWRPTDAQATRFSTSRRRR